MKDPPEGEPPPPPPPLPPPPEEGAAEGAAFAEVGGLAETGGLADAEGLLLGTDAGPPGFAGAEELVAAEAGAPGPEEPAGWLCDGAEPPLGARVLVETGVLDLCAFS